MRRFLDFEGVLLNFPSRHCICAASDVSCRLLQRFEQSQGGRVAPRVQFLEHSLEWGTSFCKPVCLLAPGVEAAGPKLLLETPHFASWMQRGRLSVQKSRRCPNSFQKLSRKIGTKKRQVMFFMVGSWGRIKLGVPRALLAHESPPRREARKRSEARALAEESRPLDSAGTPSI